MYKKLITIFCLIALITAIIIVLRPRVSPSGQSFAKVLKHSDSLPTEAVRDIKDIFAAPDTVMEVVIALHDGEIIYEHGDTAKIMNGHSTRKAILSLLYGIAVDQGLIDLDTTLAMLEIDENTPLTKQEKTATIRDLLMSRSGIYLPAEGEHDAQITQRPKRESHKPGEYYFHNNFDYNALGSIFMQETGRSIGEFMEENLAKPLGMQDFDAGNVHMGDPWFLPSNGSKHEMYYIYISPRDFARIGAMVANMGKWNGNQVVSHDWIAQSTSPISDLTKSEISYGRYDASGYIWWIDQDSNTIWTDGYGGHFMLIDQARNLTVIGRNFTGNSLLSTGLWMLKRDSHNDASPYDIIKVHEIIITHLEK